MYPKFVSYKGFTIELDRYKYSGQPVQYSYRIDESMAGRGYLSEKATRDAAKKAVDRKLERERAKA